MYDTLLSLSLIILTGIVVSRTKILGPDPGASCKAINTAVFNVFLPALCIRTVYTSPIDVETLLVPLASWITLSFCMLLSLGVYRLLRGVLTISRPEEAVLIIGSAFGNLIFLGLPVITSLYGTGAARYALFYELLAATPMLWFVVAPFASRYSGGDRMSLKDSCIAILSLPPIWGLFAGLVLRISGIQLPKFMMSSLGMFSDLVIPLMLFTTGLVLSMPKVRHAGAIIPAVLIKLCVAPIVSFTAAWFLGLKGISLCSCGLEGAMPTMVLILLIAGRFGLDESLAAFLIVITTGLAFVSLPVTHSLIAAYCT